MSETNPILLCKKNISDHSQLSRTENFTNISFDIKQEARSSAILLFSKIKSDIKAWKLKIINEERSLIQQIHKAAGNTIEKLKVYDQNLNEIISEICTLRTIDNSKPLSFIETLLSGCKLVTEKIRSPKFDIKSIDPNKIAELFNLEPLEDCFDYRERYSPMTRTIKFVCRGISNKFAIFDVKTLKVNKFSYNYNKELNCDGFGCLIPHGNLFYAWNDCWLIIDPIGNSRNITPYLICYSAGAIYVDGRIYIFGGSHEVAIKFDINQNRFSPLSKYSFPIQNRAMCTLFKDKILIASSSESPIFYDTITDSYSEILPIKLSTNTNKLFFAICEKVFLFEFSKFIYESDNNLMTWNNIGECSIISDYSTVAGYPICYKETIYIATYNYAYSFNLKEKKMKEEKAFKKSLMDGFSFWYCG